METPESEEEVETTELDGEEQVETPESKEEEQVESTELEGEEQVETPESEEEEHVEKNLDLEQEKQVVTPEPEEELKIKQELWKQGVFPCAHRKLVQRLHLSPYRQALRILHHRPSMNLSPRKSVCKLTFSKQSPAASHLQVPLKTIR